MFIRRALPCLIAIVFTSLSSCDSGQSSYTTERIGSKTFAELKSELAISIVPNSIDDAFVKIADMYEGFGGAYENESGQLVILATDVNKLSSIQVDLIASLLKEIGADDAYSQELLSKEVQVQPADYSFVELAVYRNLVERELRGNIPLVSTDVDERQNRVVLGLDESADYSADDAISRLTLMEVPPEAIAFEFVPLPQPAVSRWVVDDQTSSILPQLSDYVRPLAGGLKIDASGGCTLGVPVWYGIPGNQTRGFLTASHCTSIVGYNNNSQWGQPLQNSVAVGAEFEDPPLYDCPPSSYKCLTDAALIDLDSAHDNSWNTLPGHVYLTEFSSSTGPGGYSITDEIALNPQAPLMGQDVNKVGVRTGWTTGEITGTCVTTGIWVYHPDVVRRFTLLPCYIRADTPVNGGDSGSALFRIINDPEPIGRFLGILSACAGCNDQITSATGDGYYVSWPAISQALHQYVTMSEDQGGL